MNDWLFDLGNSRFKAAPRHAGDGIGQVQAWPHGADALSIDAYGEEALPTGRRAWLV